jgi:hypothetical protein
VSILFYYCKNLLCRLTLIYHWHCRNWGSPSGGYEEFYLLWHNATQFTEKPLTFLRNMLLPSLRLKRDQARNQLEASFQPWKWRRYVLLKHQFTFSGWHDITAQKGELFSEVTVWSGHYQPDAMLVCTKWWIWLMWVGANKLNIIWHDIPVWYQ